MGNDVGNERNRGNGGWRAVCGAVLVATGSCDSGDGREWREESGGDVVASRGAAVTVPRQRD